MAKLKLTRKRKTIYIIVGSLLILLIGLRIALPYLLLQYVNKQLTLIDGYTGHVEDIDVHLYRGAYTIREIELNKTGGKIPVPFFSADAIDLSVEWRALFHGKIVAEIEADKPILNFVNGPSNASSQKEIDKNWKVVVDHLIPFKLNRFKINQGEIHYRDFHSSPRVDLLAKDIQIVAENLSNARKAKDTLPSTVKGTATIYDGKATLDMKIDPLSELPVFDMNTRLTTVSLTNINDFLKAYGNFDAEKGSISLYTEAASHNGTIRGYTKPVIKDLKVVNWKEDKDQPLKLVWESVVESVSWVLNNKTKDQVATRVPFKGSYKEPDVDTWAIIGGLLRNAFIEALYPALENSIDLSSVTKKEEKKGFFKRLFDRSGSKQKEAGNKDQQ